MNGLVDPLTWGSLPSHFWIIAAWLFSACWSSVCWVMMVEALAILGFVDIYTQFWLRSLTFMHRGWALSTMAFGLVLAVVGALRLA